MMPYTPNNRNSGMTKAQLMRKIKEADFAVQEAILFLDTHPCNRKALKFFDGARRRSRCLTEEYERRFAPVTAAGNNCEYGWKWVSEPWPWQKDFCGCDDNKKEDC